MALKWLLSTLLIMNLCIHLSSSQKDKDYLSMIRREPIRKMKDWILCDTCKLAMKAINRRARAMRDRMKGKVIREEHYQNMTRYLCQPYHDHGEWITEYDIIKKKQTLKLQHQEVFGKCGRECESIAFACDAVLEEYWEEIPEYLYSEMSTGKLQNKVCKSMCKTKRKKRSKFMEEWGSEEFQELAEDQRQMFRQFVAGELHKQEKRFRGDYDEEKRQQDALQEFAERHVFEKETKKKNAAAARRWENKKRKRQGLDPLPEIDEETGEEIKEETDDVDEAQSSTEDSEQAEETEEPQIQKMDL